MIELIYNDRTIDIVNSLLLDSNQKKRKTNISIFIHSANSETRQKINKRLTSI